MCAKRYINKSTKEAVIDRQGYRCANNPSNPATNLADYQCLLWKYQNGIFDGAGYQFDHIDEICKSNDNSINNIQALCPNCHAVKTKKFLNNKMQFTSTQMKEGCAIMKDIDEIKPRNKKRKLITF